jgi:hypothetical protein
MIGRSRVHALPPEEYLEPYRTFAFWDRPQNFLKKVVALVAIEIISFPPQPTIPQQHLNQRQSTISRAFSFSSPFPFRKSLFTRQKKSENPRKPHIALDIFDRYLPHLPPEPLLICAFVPRPSNDLRPHIVPLSVLYGTFRLRLYLKQRHLHVRSVSRTRFVHSPVLLAQSRNSLFGSGSLSQHNCETCHEFITPNRIKLTRS